jgi:mRNA interferase MazF
MVQSCAKGMTMVAMSRTSIRIPQALYSQTVSLAQELKISRSQLFGMAIERLIRSYYAQGPGNAIDQAGQDQFDPNWRSSLSGQSAHPARQDGLVPREINQGEIYWVQLEDLHAIEPPIRHPHVIIQENVLNHSRIKSVVACALTSNLNRANEPGNIVLEAGEANLPKQSVVEVSKVSAVDKAQLGEYIGRLAESRTQQILAGMRFLQRSYFAR